MENTTLSVTKSIYQKASKKAKEQHLSVSAIVRLLLDAYAEGRIDILATQISQPVELVELNKEQLNSEVLNVMKEAYDAPESDFVNLPV